MSPAIQMKLPFNPFIQENRVWQVAVNAYLYICSFKAAGTESHRSQSLQLYSSSIHTPKPQYYTELH